MNTNHPLGLLLIASLFSISSLAQTSSSSIDYLQLPGPLKFGQTPYYLAWTSHPTSTYYKQEYLTKGDDLSQFKSMLLLDLLTERIPVKDVVSSKVAELRKLKTTNPMVSYQVIEKPEMGEYVLDFLLSQATPDGKSLSIVERNVYRYKQLTDPSGNRGILLFGISQRSYGANTKVFLSTLNQTKADLLTKVNQFAMPAITIAR
ncbi:hypothetical protein GCM10028805_55400 [Spirosoma harenae]